MRCSKCYNFLHTGTIPFYLWNGMDENAKKKKLFIFSLFLYDSLSFSSFFLHHSLHLCHTLFLYSSSFFSKIFTSPSSSSTFFFLVTFSVPLCLFFFFFQCHSLSLFLLFSPPRPLPLRLAVAMEFDLTDEVKWWRSHVSLVCVDFGDFFK